MQENKKPHNENTEWSECLTVVNELQFWQNWQRPHLLLSVNCPGGSLLTCYFVYIFMQESSSRLGIDFNSIPLGPEPRPFLQQYCSNSANLSMTPFWSPTQHSTFSPYPSARYPTQYSAFSSLSPNTYSNTPPTLPSATSVNNPISFMRPFNLQNPYGQHHWLVLGTSLSLSYIPHLH